MNIVITGAGKGIGLALSKYFTENNHSVLAISRNISRLENSASPLLIPFSFDLLEKDYTPLIHFIGNQFNQVDVLINNAGLLINKPFNLLNDDDFDRLFATNVKSVFKLSKEILSFMKEGSHIVNISSMGGFQGSVKFPGLSLYSAAKGAVSILTEAMALELLEKKISVNALALGAVQTEMLSQAFPDYQAPLTPEEMATFIAEFAITGHKYFNGKILPVSISTP